MIYLKLAHGTVKHLLIAANEIVGIVAKAHSVESIVHVLLCFQIDVLHDFITAHVGEVQETHIRDHGEQTKTVQLC